MLHITYEECWKQKEQYKAKAKTLVTKEENNTSNEEASTSNGLTKIFVTNLTMINGNLALMVKDYDASAKEALFTQNCQIK